MTSLPWPYACTRREPCPWGGVAPRVLETLTGWTFAAFRGDGLECLELLHPRRAARGRQGTGKACSAQIVLPVGM